MIQTLTLFLAFVTAHSLYAVEDVHIGIGCYVKDSKGKELGHLSIKYPLKGTHLYDVLLALYDPVDDVGLDVHYEGEGKLDRRYMEGKLVLNTPGSKDAVGTITFVDPEDQAYDPKTRDVRGRVRNFALKDEVSPVSLSGCLMGNRVK